MTHSIPASGGIIPIFNAKRRRPAGVDHCGLGHLDPLVPLHYLESDRFAGAVGNGVKLGGQLEGSIRDRVERETNDIFRRDLRDV